MSRDTLHTSLELVASWLQAQPDHRPRRPSAASASDLARLAHDLEAQQRARLTEAFQAAHSKLYAEAVLRSGYLPDAVAERCGLTAPLLAHALENGILVRMAGGLLRLALFGPSPLEGVDEAVVPEGSACSLPTWSSRTRSPNPNNSGQLGVESIGSGMRFEHPHDEGSRANPSKSSQRHCLLRGFGERIRSRPPGRRERLPLDAGCRLQRRR